MVSRTIKKNRCLKKKRISARRPIRGGELFSGHTGKYCSRNIVQAKGHPTFTFIFKNDTDHTITIIKHFTFTGDNKYSLYIPYIKDYEFYKKSTDDLLKELIRLNYVHDALHELLNVLNRETILECNNNDISHPSRRPQPLKHFNVLLILLIKIYIQPNFAPESDLVVTLLNRQQLLYSIYNKICIESKWCETNGDIICGKKDKYNFTRNDIILIIFQMQMLTQKLIIGPGAHPQVAYINVINDTIRDNMFCNFSFEPLTIEYLAIVTHTIFSKNLPQITEQTYIEKFKNIILRYRPHNIEDIFAYFILYTIKILQTYDVTLLRILIINYILTYKCIKNNNTFAEYVTSFPFITNIIYTILSKITNSSGEYISILSKIYTIFSKEFNVDNSYNLTLIESPLYCKCNIISNEKPKESFVYNNLPVCNVHVDIVIPPQVITADEAVQLFLTPIIRTYSVTIDQLKEPPPVRTTNINVILPILTDTDVASIYNDIKSSII